MGGTGKVLSLYVYPNLQTVCMWIGPDQAHAELMFVKRDADPEDQASFVNNIVDVLLSAFEHQYEIGFYVHPNNAVRITSISLTQP